MKLLDKNDKCFCCNKKATRGVYDGIGLLITGARFFMCKRHAKLYIKRRKREMRR